MLNSYSVSSIMQMARFGTSTSSFAARKANYSGKWAASAVPKEDLKVTGIDLLRMRAF
jgi:hypothetical protein